MRGSHWVLGRRLGVAVGVIGMLVVPSPAARATATVTIASAGSHCSVNLLVGTTNEPCPVHSRNITGSATATATANAAMRTFTVGASAQPNPYLVGGRSALGLVELRSNVVTSKGGPVKVVLSNLSGGTTTRCPQLCAAMGHTGASVGVWVILALQGDDAPSSPQALCPVSFGNAPAPRTFVVPDDCSPGAALDAPPNSSFIVWVSVTAQAQAEGGAAEARSALAGGVSEIRVP